MNSLRSSTFTLVAWVMWVLPSAPRHTTWALTTSRGVWKRPTFRWMPSPPMFVARDISTFRDTTSIYYQRPYRNTQSKTWPFFQSFMSTMDTDVEGLETDVSGNKTIASTWDVPGLKKEVVRLVQRGHKKVQQAHQRLSKAKEETVEQLATDPAATMEQLEQCPDVDTLAAELENVQSRLQRLNSLEEMLGTLPSKKQAVLPEHIASLAIELNVNDAPPVRPARDKKEKGPRRDEPSRKPYRRYFSVSGIEIRVGKKAEGNDELTMSPLHRDGSDWWMHAAGCPGSHVVIRCGDDNLPEEVVQDAAALAARQSKCTGSVIKVSLTRCRDIVKPPGAKAGLVMLKGKVRTVSVNMKAAEARLDRLETTVLVN